MYAGTLPQHVKSRIESRRSGIRTESMDSEHGSMVRTSSCVSNSSFSTLFLSLLCVSISGIVFFDTRHLHRTVVEIGTVLEKFIYHIPARLIASDDDVLSMQL